MERPQTAGETMGWCAFPKCAAYQVRLFTDRGCINYPIQAPGILDMQVNHQCILIILLSRDAFSAVKRGWVLQAGSWPPTNPSAGATRAQFSRTFVKLKGKTTVLQHGARETPPKPPYRPFPHAVPRRPTFADLEQLLSSYLA